jgi:outer membrane receptor protein involved in Fe transport
MLVILRKIYLKSYVIFFLGLVLSPFFALAQQMVTGQVLDANSEPIINAIVRIKGTNAGTYTDIEGKFSLKSPIKPPIYLVVTMLGYDSALVEVLDFNKPVAITLKEEVIQVETIEIIKDRKTEKEKESPMTVERLDLIAIKETPAANFYDGLGSLKGVDVTSASMGFKIINTRGFNSTRPVRSLQIIDGVDNQAPGLNFSLGNLVGASELDVQSVDLIVGASSSMYGPGAFNGVISMTTKNPFLHPGLSVQLKVGERDLFDGAVRYARVFKDKEGRDRFAFKLNTSFMRAYDWEATNADSTYKSEAGPKNPGGYNAVNRYGDERAFFLNPITSPGVGYFFRSGYWEKDLVDYNTKSIKLAGSLHYKIPGSKLEAIYGYSFGTGTTVFQGDNRYSLRDLVFQQHKLELQSDKISVQAYVSLEDAGKSYDAVRTALFLQDQAKPDFAWLSDYTAEWRRRYDPRLRRLADFNFDTATPRQIADFLAAIQDSLTQWHARTRAFADGKGNPFFPYRARFEPGTPEFIRRFREITSNPNAREGSRLIDFSKLYHMQGKYTIDHPWLQEQKMLIQVGASFRLYVPDSRGTVFSDTLINSQDSSLGYRRISVWEVGVFSHIEKKLLDEKLKLNFSLRLDKNQNFAPLLTPAFSTVYTYEKKHNFRFLIASAIRNPTLQDQYLYFNLGRAIIIGNLEGVNNVVELQDYLNWLNSTSPRVRDLYSQNKIINVKPVKPERAVTFELGYKGNLLDNLYLDAGYFYSLYFDFLGFKFISTIPDSITYLSQVYRVTTNARDMVTTQGFSLGFNYFIWKYFELNGNYTWNILERHGSTDPIIPAFNTPRHKFNMGFTGRDIKFRLGGQEIRNWGFNFNFKWVESFFFEGAPAPFNYFTGIIPTYYVLDGQVNYTVPKWKTTFKLGATNLLNRQYLQVYGGPYIGRLAYFSINIDLK